MDLYNILSINGIDIDEYLNSGGSSEDINEIKQNTYYLNTQLNILNNNYYSSNIAYINSSIYERFLINNNYEDIDFDFKEKYLYIYTINNPLDVQHYMDYYTALLNNIFENFKNVHSINIDMNKIVFENTIIPNPLNGIDHSDITMLDTQSFKSIIINCDYEYEPHHFNFVGGNYNTIYDLFKINYTNLVSNFSNISVSTFILNVKDNRTSSKVKMLTEKETISEIARISSGSTSIAALNHAKELRERKLKLVI